VAAEIAAVFSFLFFALVLCQLLGHQLVQLLVRDDLAVGGRAGLDDFLGLFHPSPDQQPTRRLRDEEEDKQGEEPGHKCHSKESSEVPV